MTTKVSAPDGAKLEVTILIDRIEWNKLKEDGYSDDQIMHSIEKSLTFNNAVGGIIPTPPILDVESATLLKYY
jgi:hypothetical protein